MPTAFTASMASIALPGPTGRSAARKARANCMMFSESRLAAGAAATIRAIACAERALKTPPPTWGRSGRGKPRFGVRQSSLASPTPTRPQIGGGGMMFGLRCEIALRSTGRAELGRLEAPEAGVPGHAHGIVEELPGELAGAGFVAEHVVAGAQELEIEAVDEAAAGKPRILRRRDRIVQPGQQQGRHIGVDRLVLHRILRPHRPLVARDAPGIVLREA